MCGLRTDVVLRAYGRLLVECLERGDPLFDNQVDAAFETSRVEDKCRVDVKASYRQARSEWYNNHLESRQWGSQRRRGCCEVPVRRAAPLTRSSDGTASASQGICASPVLVSGLLGEVSDRRFWPVPIGHSLAACSRLGRLI